MYLRDISLRFNAVLLPHCAYFITKAYYSTGFFLKQNIATTLINSEVSIILKFKSGFVKAVQEVCKLLDKYDDCLNHRYTKVAFTSDGNPDRNIVYYDSVQCKVMVCHVLLVGYALSSSEY